MPATRQHTAISTMCLIGGIILMLIADAFPLQAQEWHPGWPEKDQKDWIQLKSGEWLRGDMDLFRDLKMEFDSDKLKELQIKWEDIVAFRLPREMTFVFEGQKVYTGSASMRDGVIRINTESGPLDFNRRDLLTIIEGKPRERNFWAAKLSLGTTFQSGNTDKIDLSSRLQLKREATRSSLSLEYRGSYSEVSKLETVNNHKGIILINLFISRMFYVTPATVEYYSDKFQNIDARYTLGAGVGYYFFRQSNIDWSVGLGGGYQVTEFLSVEAGEDPKEKNGSVIPSTNLDWDITGDIELEFEYRSLIGVPDRKSSSHHAAMDLSIDFYKDIFELTLSLLWDRVDNPKAYSDGTVPEKDDLKVVFGFGVDI